MRCHPTERATVFASRLREQLATCKVDSDKELSMITAILEAELGMAWTSATLKQKVPEGGSPSENINQIDEDWLNEPIKLAAYVGAAIIPQSYVKLKETLCPCEDTGLWAHLSKTQLSASLFQHVNGTNTTGQILAQLKQTDAADEILQGVEAGFLQLLISGMLEFA